MRKIDEIGFKTLQNAGGGFSASVSETNCSSPIFMRRFMNSQVAQRMDLGGFLFEACDVNQIFQEIETELAKAPTAKKNIPKQNCIGSDIFIAIGLTHIKKQAGKYINLSNQKNFAVFITPIILLIRHSRLREF